MQDSVYCVILFQDLVISGSVSAEQLIGSGVSADLYPLQRDHSIKYASSSHRPAQMS